MKIAIVPIVPICSAGVVVEEKIGKKALRMSSGEIRHFKTKKGRDDFERIAKAVKYGGFEPGKGKWKKKKKR